MIWAVRSGPISQILLLIGSAKGRERGHESVYLDFPSSVGVSVSISAAP